MIYEVVFWVRCTYLIITYSFFCFYAEDIVVGSYMWDLYVSMRDAYTFVGDAALTFSENKFILYLAWLFNEIIIYLK
jgi:hypothetical protein